MGHPLHVHGILIVLGASVLSGCGAAGAGGASGGSSIAGAIIAAGAIGCSASPAQTSTSTSTNTSTSISLSAPSALTYATNGAAYAVGSLISPSSPSSYGGAIDCYTISPALPSGLVLNQATGVISGTPTALMQATDFQIIGSNAAGWTATVLRFSVGPAVPSKPKSKLDLVIFQDNSNSLANEVAFLKTQLQGFLAQLDPDLDYRIVVLPLSFQQSISQKIVLASDCSKVNGAGRCMGPSDVTAFNSVQGDAAWITTQNSAAGNTGLGFAYMNYNVNSLTSSGFFRSDARKAFIVLSNGEDSTNVTYSMRPDGSILGIDYSSATTTSSFNAYLNYFNGLKTSIGLSKFYSVVAAQRYTSCWGGGGTWQGKRYMDLAQGIGGTSFDLCSGGFSHVLSDIGVDLGSPASSSIGSGQCATISSGTATTLTFYGQLSNSSTGIVGNLSAYGYGSQSFGGSNYYRNLSNGDSVNAFVSGQSAYATLSISANTATAIVQGQSGGYGYGNNNGTAQVCGISINESIFANAISGPGYTGTMGGGQIALWGSNNWLQYQGGGLILF